MAYLCINSVISILMPRTAKSLSVSYGMLYYSWVATIPIFFYTSCGRPQNIADICVASAPALLVVCYSTYVSYPVGDRSGDTFDIVSIIVGSSIPLTMFLMSFIFFHVKYHPKDR